jgi:uncharacterized protein (TIGR03085 family)
MRAARPHPVLDPFMGRHSIAAAERQSLCDLLEELGPAAPTLCTGWDTVDMAAHLMVRERRPDVLPGLVVPGPPAAHTQRVTENAKTKMTYGEMVRRLRGGPPFGLMSLPGLEDAGNLLEFYVHHEDVRRAQPGWMPRELSPELDQALWSRLRRSAPLLFRRVRGVAITLRTPDGRATRAKGAGRPAKPAKTEAGEHVVGGTAAANGTGNRPSVTLSGTPGELVLFAMNRRAAAEVQVTGDQAGVARLAAARLGL